MEEKDICPKCGSESLIEYDDYESYDEDSDVEHEVLYEFQCTYCGHKF